MSYEGYFRALCSAGHLTTADINESDSPPTVCQEIIKGKICKEKIVWHELVDTTNGEELVTPLEVVGREKIHTCPLCGDLHTCQPATYRIPNSDSGDINQHENKKIP
jgi:hypothetical protein